jgi:hypothetical protein
MTGRRSSRRGFLGAVIGGVTLLGSARLNGVLAEPTQAPNQSREGLKSDCDHNGGTYIESKKDDVTACYWSGGGKTACRYDGTHCYNYPDPKPKSSPTEGNVDPFGGFGDMATTYDGEITYAGPSDGITPAPAADEAESTGPARKRRRHGKRRR